MGAGWESDRDQHQASRRIFYRPLLRSFRWARLLRDTDRVLCAGDLSIHAALAQPRKPALSPTAQSIAVGLRRGAAARCLSSTPANSAASGCNTTSITRAA